MEPAQIGSRYDGQGAGFSSGLPLGVPLGGQVSRLNQARHYAFIRLSNGRLVYAHWSALSGLRFAELRPDQQVKCWLEIGAAGLVAVRVRGCGVRRRRQPKSGNKQSLS